MEKTSALKNANSLQRGVAINMHKLDQAKKLALLYPPLSKKIFIIILVLSENFSTWAHYYYNSWDFKNYHWYNAYAFLHHRMNFDIASAQMQTYFNPLLDTFNYFLVKFLVYTPLYEFFFGIIAGISIFFIIKIAQRLFFFQSKQIYWFAVACAVVIEASDPIFISQIGLGFTNTETQIFIILALYLGIRITDTETFKPALYLSFFMGISLGAAMGLKLTNPPYLLAIIVAFWIYKKPSLHHLSLFFAFLIGFTFLFFITEG